MSLFNWIRKCFGQKIEVENCNLAIGQFDINGKHIETFSTLEDIIIKFPSFNKVLIEDCIVDIRPNYKGYIWKEILE